MRLLHTSTLTLVDTDPRSTPPYAILSHVWGKDERPRREGFDKVRQSCAVAAACKLDYIWIDTCCINKTSSAELSEAINSMFRWYRDAEVCFAYMADVPFNVYRDPGQAGVRDAHMFVSSRWFTRGWTLQELLSPANVVFLDNKWNIIGTKSSLKETVADVTGIPSSILTGRASIGSASAAQRMSWASKRETTRVEDTAYCLLGIFDIHMPLLYGEGDRAFIRLQEEIMRTSGDSSLFAWASETETHDGLLASSPAAFGLSSHIQPPPSFGFQVQDLNPDSFNFSVSGKGIHFSTFIHDLGGGSVLAVLDCTNGAIDGDAMFIAIPLKDTGFTRTNFVRGRHFQLCLVCNDLLDRP
ncbi:HET-domain-containing protein [Podospora aff. communis PSN243]|uniref:HET-domain-containing protein n=1 Tax=Podospora aff. communis PSN243 TaxID=3040156 RepID=A0AAV9G3B0_9PEZI|nr:HET-domain-containing protein [Podospora aff. communis PSN243]